MYSRHTALSGAAYLTYHTAYTAYEVVACVHTRKRVILFDIVLRVARLHYLRYVLYKAEQIVCIIYYLYLYVACFSAGSIHIYILVTLYLIFVQTVKQSVKLFFIHVVAADMKNCGNVFVIVCFVQVVRKFKYTYSGEVIQKYIPIMAAVAVFIKKAHMISSQTVMLTLLYNFLL